MEIIIASQNQNKIDEIRLKMPFVTLKPLDPLIFPEELLETGETLESNAIQKVKQVYARTNSNCFADDTGLEIEALNGEPGVFSARYAGPHKNSIDNINLVLEKMKNKANRNARFRTVVALMFKNELHVFEGICKGVILKECKGIEGFGYDPIFMPSGENKSFAEMTMEAKNNISHRAKAIEQLVEFIREQYSS
jgi:XTP/dITP diphosphohydrolase